MQCIFLPVISLQLESEAERGLVTFDFGACSIRILEAVGRVFFLFPTNLGRSKKTARRVTVLCSLDKMATQDILKFRQATWDTPLAGPLEWSLYLVTVEVCGRSFCFISMHVTREKGCGHFNCTQVWEKSMSLCKCLLPPKRINTN